MEEKREKKLLITCFNECLCTSKLQTLNERLDVQVTYKKKNKKTDTNAECIRLAKH